MVTKKFNIIPILILILSVIAISSILSSETLLEITRYNDSGKVIGTESIKLPRVTSLQQSLSGIKTLSFTWMLQSTIPSTEDTNIARMRVEITNPLDINIKLTQITVYKNDKQLQSTQIYKTLTPGEIFIFKTDELDLGGEETVLNTIKLTAFLESTDGREFSQTYLYNYYPLVSCVTNTDCKAPNILCDLDNIAGYSDGEQTFCVKPCGASTDCVEGQLCIKRRCGYGG